MRKPLSFLVGIFIITPLLAQEKLESAFFPPSLVSIAQNNAEKYPWAAEIKSTIIKMAQPWKELSDQQTWDLMFSSTLPRSWFVRSNGVCPSCQGPTPLETWLMDAWQYPWKVKCPHCSALFPKNDFHKYYLSGLDEHRIFQYDRADKSLLFNTDHPDPQDPLHKFGVDDGHGFTQGEATWYFIGAYLYYGQWRQFVQDGIEYCANAYILTSDPVYARKALILFDRVADLFPDFDYLKQGYMYEKFQESKGYVGYWAGSNWDVRRMAMAYDKVKSALPRDQELVSFLKTKARECQLSNPKTTWQEIRKNIEERIFQDAIKNQNEKIRSNYPSSEVTVTFAKTALGWPGNRAEVLDFIAVWIDKAVAVDGISGEKGIYSKMSPQRLASFISVFSRIDPGFAKELFEKNPRLQLTWKLHTQLTLLDNYTAIPGDGGELGTRVNYMGGMEYNPKVGLSFTDEVEFGPFGNVLWPGMYQFFWDLYQITGDPSYVQVLYFKNGGKVDGLPHDIFCPDPETFQKKVAEVIAKVGTTIELPSVNFQEYAVGVLRAGQGDFRRAATLSYHSGAQHGHWDGMHLGLYAHGYNLLPDQGYPPIQFGGWETKETAWTKASVNHNTVIVDGKNLQRARGATTLFADGKFFRALRVSAPQMIAGEQFERTLIMVDINEKDSYLVEVFRVMGGRDHTKFLNGPISSLATEGLKFTDTPALPWGHESMLRNFKLDPAPAPGWTATWKIQDYYKYLPAGTNLFLQYRDFTTDAATYTCEGWVLPNGREEPTEEYWAPRLIIRHQQQPDTDKSLLSTFVGFFQSYTEAPAIKNVRRTKIEPEWGNMYPDNYVALEIDLPDGGVDYLVAVDVENPAGLTPSYQKNLFMLHPFWNDIRLDAQIALIRKNKEGKVTRIAFSRGRELEILHTHIKLEKDTDLFEQSY